MEIAEILKLQDAAGKINELKKRKKETPAGELLKQFDQSQHKIMDASVRPDKIITSGKTVEEGGDGIVQRTEAVARIALALQKLIVKRAAAFLFGNPVKYYAEPANDTDKLLFDGIKKILEAVKINSFNRRLAREVFRATEAAECWYPVKAENVNYGFSSKYKLRVVIFSPLLGDELYPLYDSLGDLVAFSREYVTKVGTEETTFFETWTADKYLQWERTREGWTEVKNTANIVGKIPIIYASQEAAEWADVQILIERLEKLLSNFADTNDYHAAPKIFVTGEVQGFAQKGESGAIIEGSDGATAQYLAWQFAPEAVKLEISTLLNMIYTMTQTPDISFETVRGIGAVSGVALKLLFMDAHLKVLDKLEIFDEYLQRRVNLLKAYCGVMNVELARAANLAITPEVTPYIIGDEKTIVETLSIANGGKPLISVKTGVALSGLVDDVDAEADQIAKEAQEENTMNVFEPTA